MTATASFGAVATVLLIVLLVEQLVAGPGRGGQARVLRAVVEPLLALVALILAVRLVAIAS